MRDLDRIRDKTVLTMDSRQLFFVFFGGSVAAALLFALGVIVGRKLPAEDASAEEDPLAMLDQLGAEEETLSFQKGLKGRAQAPAPSVVPPPAASAAPAARLVEAEPPPQAPRLVPPETAQPEPAPPAATQEPAPKVERASRKRPTAQPDGESAVATTETGRFTLQLSSFQEKDEAAEFMKALDDKGYVTYIVSAEVPGRGLWYRVRLGDYSTHADALAAKSDFERKQRIIAYVLRK